MPDSLTEAFRNSPVRALPGRYAVARCARLPDGAACFMVARDADEVTAVVQESELPRLPVLSHQSGYRLIEIRVAVPPGGVGFLAAVTRALAEVGVSVLVVSTYSKDYLLVKEQSLAAALGALAGLGFPVLEP